MLHTPVKNFLYPNVDMKPAIDLPQVLKKDAEDKFEAFCNAAENIGVSLPDDPEFLCLLKRVFAFSDFVSKSCIQNPEMFESLMNSGDLQRSFAPDDYAATLGSILLSAKDDSELSICLRRFRRREMVRIAWRDLSGWADLSETMTDLSALADTCLDQTVSILYQWQCAECGTPAGSDGLPQHLVVVGMGKLGGQELNFSSDIDLIFAYPEIGETRGNTEPIGNDEFFIRICRRLVKIMGATLPNGIVFRVDMDLRPYGASGPLAMSFDAMETYYQEQGREWERYAWVKARIVAGDKYAGERLLESLRPFVYRRYLDFGIFDSLRQMKQMISLEVKRKGMANNIKLGLGGIREIEFFCQIFQLIRGGVSPDLQERSIKRALATLFRENHISRQVCDELKSAYDFLRNTEHRLQAFSDQQTHELPTDPVAKIRLAVSMHFETVDAFEQCLQQHRDRVHYHFSKLLEPGDSSYPNTSKEKIETRLQAIWLELAEKEVSRKELAGAGFEHPDEVMRLLNHLRNDPATRSLSVEGRKRLDKLMPLVLKAIGQSEQPIVALNRIIDLIRSIEKRTNYLSLLLENPTAVTHLASLANASPWIVTFLARHPVLLDELLDPRTLYSPPDKQQLAKEIRKRLNRIPSRDLEYQIQELCIFKQINTLRVAAADVTGTLPLMRTSDHLTEIAETILDEVLAISWRHLVDKHGEPNCRLEGKHIRPGFTVIAYGKLGGIELGYGADLDLVFLHAGIEGQTRGEQQPIDNAQFFARLGQRVVHILSAHTPAGMLYEPDMRLRPSGSSGLLVSHINGFKDYQMNQAWTWEHQALVKARPVGGDQQLAERFTQIRSEVLARPRSKTRLQDEVVNMRERLRNELLKPEPGYFDLKQGRGGIVDVEFLLQYLVLLNAYKHAELLKWTDIVRLLITLIKTGIIQEDTAHLLRIAYLTYRTAAHQLGLQEKPGKVPENKFRKLRKEIESIWKDFMGVSAKI